MCDRKTEMERKKAKLVALREDQKCRRLLRERQEAAAAATRRAGYDSRRVLEYSTDGVESLDDMLSSFGLAPVGDVLLNRQNEPVQSKVDTPEKACGNVVGELQDMTNLPDHVATHPQHRMALLSKEIRAVVNYPPREVITYVKHTQTDAPRLEEMELEAVRTSRSSFGGGDMATSISDKVVQTVPHCDSTEVPPRNIKPKQMTDKEKQMILMSDEFLIFFGRATRYVERALSEKNDIFKDYTRSVTSANDDANESKQLLSLHRHFSHNIPHTSVVTSLDWSTQYPELILASYFLEQPYSKVGDGLCLIWNMMYGKETPEYVFQCGSRVMASKFTEFHHNLIIGGTYSGQIVLWDTRSHKKTPVVQSAMCVKAHTQPVCSLNMIGSLSSHHLVSASAESQVCTWSLDMLLKPQDVIDLRTRKGKSIYPMCVDFPYKDCDSFMIGSGYGFIHHTCRLGENPGLTDSIQGHYSPVTQISSFAAKGGEHLSHMYLTSSFDRSVKLWSRQGSRPVQTFKNFNEDVFDVQWSPTHPGVFAVVDGEGRLQIWNLSAPTIDRFEVPAVETCVQHCPALNRVSWASSGQQIAVGDDHGKVWVYDVSEKLAKPTERDWAAMTKTFPADKHGRDESAEISEDTDEFYSL